MMIGNGINLGQIGRIKIIENKNCLQTWQLNDFTKELMGKEWVDKFNLWAEYALPKQPACYMIGGDTMIAHPEIVNAVKLVI